MADNKRESREVKLIGLEHNTSDLDWGLYALAENGVKYAISESEYDRLFEERHATGGIPALDYSQVLFVKTDDGNMACVKCAKQEDNTSNLTVSVTADVNEAITGFKALQRELRETTKAARELEQAYKDAEMAVNRRRNDDGTRDNFRFKAGEGMYEGIGFIIDNSTDKPVTMFDYSEIPTEHLTKELAKRKREGLL